MLACTHPENQTIGTHPTWGEVYWCPSCGQLYHLESARLWDEASPTLVPVHYGPRLFGLENALNCGANIPDLEKVKVLMEVSDGKR